MNKLGKSIVGVVASVAATGGAYSAEGIVNNFEQQAVERCIEKFQEQDRRDCIKHADINYNNGSVLDLVEIAGSISIAGFGYMAYKTVKEEEPTTSPITQS